MECFTQMKVLCLALKVIATRRRVLNFIFKISFLFKADLSSYILTIPNDKTYRLQVIGITPYGTKFTSNEVTYRNRKFSVIMHIVLKLKIYTNYVLAGYIPKIIELKIQDLTLKLKWNLSESFNDVNKALILWSINGSSYSYYYC